MNGSAAAREIPRDAGDLSLDRVRRDPLRFIEAQIARYGDVFRYELGGFSAVFLGLPEYARHVLQTRPRNYVKSGTPDLMMLKPMLGNGLMTSEGAEWREQRTTVQPAFQPGRLEQFAATIVHFTDEMAERWPSQVDIESEMSRLTLRVIASVLFGYDLRHSSVDFAASVAVMNEFMAHFDPADRVRLNDFREARATVARVTQDILDSGRAGRGPGDDLLRMLLAARHPDGSPFTDQELRDQIFTFLMAGHETTAKTLTWTLYLLALNPAFRERVRAEARSVLAAGPAPDPARLQLSWMAVQEAMRLYPPVWLMSRMAVEDDVVDGYGIPAGTLVVISPWILHRDERHWPEPLRYDPDRFAPERVAGIAECAFLPFSTGPRACVGRRLAALETTLVVAKLLQRFDLDVVPGHPVEPEALVTLRPRFGMQMHVTEAV